MGIIKSKFKKMEEFDCSMDDMDRKEEEKQEMQSDPRSPSSAISRTPMNEVRAKSSLITRATNLTNISTPIHHDLLMIQDKRFKHLAHSFIDPRSPSEGIVRTPIVIKSSEISSIINTPRILEEELNEAEEDDEDFQKTFEERLSRLSFDNLDQEEQEAEESKRKAHRMPDLIETHFDECLIGKPAPPMTLITDLVAQGVFDPRSPTIGIDRTPLVFGDRQPVISASIKPTTSPTFAEQLKAGELLLQDEQEEEEAIIEDVTKDVEKGENEKKDKEEEENKEEETDAKDTEEASAAAIEQNKPQPPTITVEVDQEDANEEPQKKSQSDVFVDVGRVIYGTPVALAASGGPIQQNRTPLSCLANRKRAQLNKASANGKSPATSNTVSKKGPKGQLLKEAGANNCGELKVKKTAATNPFESTTPRKAIR